MKKIFFIIVSCISFISLGFAQNTGGITIKKVLDNNCDGKIDAADGIGAGWQFNIFGPNGFNTTVTTNTTGSASLTGLASGTYNATEVPQSGWVTSTPTQTTTVGIDKISVLTFFNCKKNCIETSNPNIVCGSIIGGSQKYNVSTTVTNNSTSAATYTAAVTGGGIISSLVVTPATIPAGGSASVAFVYSPGSLTPCFTSILNFANGTAPCKKDNCIQQLPVCQPPKPCIQAIFTNIICNPPNAAGNQTYTVLGVVSNGNAVPTSLNVSNSISGGTVSSTTPSTIAANAANIPFSFVYTPGNVAPCFIVSLSAPTFLCKDTICAKLPPKCCLDLTYKLECNKNINAAHPETYVYTVTVVNPTNTAVSIAMASTTGTLSPSVITAAANTSTIFSVYYNHTSTSSSNACIKFGVGIIPLAVPLCKIPVECTPLPICPPVMTNKCCPTTRIKGCCITPFEIKYEYAATLPVSICGMIVSVTPSTGVVGGGVYTPTFVGTVVPNGYTSFSPPAAAGSTLTYYLTIPISNPLGVVSVKYVTCAGDTCDVEKFKIGSSPNLVSAGLTNVVSKDSLFAASYRLDLSKIGDNTKVKSVSIVPIGQNSGNLFFAISGTELNGNENKSLIPLSDALQGTSSATFVFKNALNKSNYKDELLNIVTRKSIKQFKIIMFDEEGLKISESTIAGSITPITTASKETKSNVTSLSISPNPATDHVNLSYFLGSDQNMQIDLIDLTGKVVNTIDKGFKNANQMQNLEFNVSNLQNGLYFIRLVNEKGQTIVEKLNVLH